MTHEIAMMWADILHGKVVHFPEEPEPNVLPTYYGVRVPICATGSGATKTFTTSAECFKEAMDNHLAEVSWGPR